MKEHTTNYFNTFIQVADDCSASAGEIPPAKEARTVASMQHELISKKPYHYTSDDVLFEVYAQKNELAESERPKAREQFFSKGQPCLRSSPLTKRYGWGVHSDGEGKIAIYGLSSDDYKKLSRDKGLSQVKAMRSSKK